MSVEKSRREFESLLDEYVRGELSVERARACDQYLAAHPESRREVSEVEVLLLSPAWRAAGDPPAGLLEQSMARVEQHLEAPVRRTAKHRFAARSWRPAVAWSALAAAVVVGSVLLWPSATPVVFADVISRLQEVGSLQVEGWVRGEDGRQVPYRQLLLADGTFRADVGAPGRERVVVWRDGVRRVKDSDGLVYRSEDRVRGPERPLTLQSVLLVLQALYRDEDPESANYTFTREQLGDITRFTRRNYAPLGRVAGNREWSLDVNVATALPVASRVRELVADEWLAMSELRFTGFDGEVTPETFAVDGPDLEIDDAARERLWFELGISPASIQVPAVVAPAGDAEVIWLGAADMPAGMTGGGSQNFDGGVTVFEMHNLALKNVVTMASRLPVIENQAANRRTSLRLRSKTALPWQRQLAPVLSHAGLRAEITTRSAERIRYEFELNGKALKPSRYEFPDMGVTGAVDGYHYSFRKVPLYRVIEAMMGNSSLRSSALDTMTFDIGGEAGSNAFATEVDFEFHNPDHSWETNLASLREQFGVEVIVREETVNVNEITLLDAK